MKFKKISAALLAAMLAFSVSAGTTYAAKGGAKLSAPKVSAPAPKANTAAPKSDTAATKKDSPNTKEYAPSKKASEYNSTAPAAKNSTNANTANAAKNTNTGSRWGNALRNIGLFAGGMLLGSLLGNMLGSLFPGLGGMLGDVMGLIFNLIMIYAVYRIIKWGINKFRGKGSSSDSSESDIRAKSQPVQFRDISRNGSNNTAAAPRSTSFQDIKGPSSSGYGYDAKRTADRYRKM